MTIYRSNKLFLIAITAIFFLVFSQISGAQTPQPAPDIPRDYRGITLGMNPEDVKNLLGQDGWFNYRGEADVSLLERPRASLIDAGGSLFINRGLFQFEESKLSAIMLELNPETVDWFTVYTTLEERYGSPVDLDPSKAWWEDGNTRLALERPLTVKYLDLSVFEAALSQESDRIAWREKAREEFLDEF